MSISGSGDYMGAINLLENASYTLLANISRVSGAINAGGSSILKALLGDRSVGAFDLSLSQEEGMDFA